MADERKFSRQRHGIKLVERETVERELFALMQETLGQQGPTVPPAAIRVISELTATIASLLLAETQANQRALTTLEDELAHLSIDFVSQLVAHAKKDGASKIRRTSAIVDTLPGTLQLADDWAGPVAGPTLIEKHFGIPRSTLYRWQKRNEVVALNTRTSRKPVFPLRQFVDGRPAEGIADVIQILSDPRFAWNWLLSPHASFDERQPLEALLAGEVPAVLEAARLVTR